MVTLPTTTTRVDTTTAERINTDPVLDVITTAPASTETSETPAPATTTDANENANALGNTYAYLTRIMDSTPVNVTTENTVATAEPRIVVETPGVVTPEVAVRTLTLTDLPAEVLRLVLWEAAVDSPVERRCLLGVCFLWRDILVNMFHLWTSLRIISSYENDAGFERFLWRLDLQLQRCGPLMLDVHWRTTMSYEQTTQLFALLSKRAPFSRWKSLVLEYCDNGAFNDDMLTGMSDFRNLTSLKITYCAPERLLRRVNDSVTSKLTDFGFNYTGMTISQFNSEMNSILKHVSVIQLPNFDVDSTVFLPDNVKEITSYYVPNCAFPHVTSVTTTGWNPVRRFKNRHFPNLEYLSTMFTRPDASMDVPVVLASLTTLIVSGCEYEPLALMTLPNLNVLRIRTSSSEQGSYKHEINTLRTAVTRRELNLSPTGVLEIDVPVPADVLIMAVKRMGVRAKEVVLRVREAYEGWGMLRKLFILPPLSTSTVNAPKETMVMPRLQKLELLTKVYDNEANQKVWRAFMTRILEERRGSSLESVKTVFSGDSRAIVTRTDLLI
ncbi:SubName: Full=Uncharacterized protein {ECO:0000313/EMBL:CCA74679.1} [Serendipita indica DSM 11827]|uniref:F-box domain-containing protein n=1 Tax=Serendipita indica (strain DSM 11827) TaxID=1109443 RepID=G4TTN6_SERID|nr:SubName: Full=Uncharacterized protein {ECO:0000313/EMBL:CCA74679.1} [Serendipita indica DSM 11827]CCA74679.1 hypothetical protein PIIN_08630 [Serendipita indica DSM 11827]